MIKHKLYIYSVQKNINDKVILSYIFLECETNDIVGILGRNGSGKSTLLKIIFGTTNADNKFIKLDDKIIRKELYKVSDTISYLPQENFLPHNLRVSKVVELGVDESNAEKFYADDFIFKLKDFRIKDLSSGESRYLEIKLILFSNSKFILLDEPFSGLSPIIIEKVKKEIKRCSLSKAIILTDHNFNEGDIVTKLYLLKNGKNHKIIDKEDLVKMNYVNNF
jgi:ABC-type multidrug transport system ATPase subunit